MTRRRGGPAGSASGAAQRERTVFVVCPNLAVDYTLYVDRLSVGQVHRCRHSVRRAGGKGVNTARALKALGERVLICGLAGGANGEMIEAGLAEEGFTADIVPMEGESRTCVIVVSSDGQATVVNEPGPRFEDSTKLLDRFETYLSGVQAVALMGSLPPGFPVDTFAEMTRRARQLGLPCLLDTSGPALEWALAEGPTYAKPNRAEAEALLGRPLSGEAEWMKAVEEIRNAGADAAFLTLAALGAVVAAPGVKAKLSPPNVRAVNATGAGDAMAAGILAGHLRGLGFRDIANLGIAAAAASTLRGYGRIDPESLRPEEVRWTDPAGIA